MLRVYQRHSKTVVAYRINSTAAVSVHSVIYS